MARLRAAPCNVKYGLVWYDNSSFGRMRRYRNDLAVYLIEHSRFQSSSSNLSEAFSVYLSAQSS